MRCKIEHKIWNIVIDMALEGASIFEQRIYDLMTFSRNEMALMRQEASQVDVPLIAEVSSQAASQSVSGDAMEGMIITVTSALCISLN